ncbi:MAG: two pore domain potassium channel family protein, partial [Lachnospiraceae bacterium]|nr:two pore domain potassium channel family protein [Lachnospiraceae bacterium]
FTNAFSGLWWSVSTLSTIGYGDIYPVTILGKILAIIISLLGMSVVAIPTGIITAGFMEAAASEIPDPAGGLANGPLNRRVLDITGPGTAAEAPARYYRGWGHHGTDGAGALCRKMCRDDPERSRDTRCDRNSHGILLSPGGKEDPPERRLHDHEGDGSSHAGDGSPPCGDPGKIDRGFGGLLRTDEQEHSDPERTGSY